MNFFLNEYVHIRIFFPSSIFLASTTLLLSLWVSKFKGFVFFVIRQCFITITIGMLSMFLVGLGLIYFLECLRSHEDLKTPKIE